MKRTPDDSTPAAPAALNDKRRAFAKLLLCAPLGATALTACGSGGGSGSISPPIPPPPPPPPPLPPGPPVFGPAWPGYARDAQHSALGAIASQPFSRIRWLTQVDLAPQYTRLVAADPLRLAGDHRTQRRHRAGEDRRNRRLSDRGPARGRTAIVLWSAATDYVLPPHNWVPSFEPCITPGNRVYAPRVGRTPALSRRCRQQPPARSRPPCSTARPRTRPRPRPSTRRSSSTRRSPRDANGNVFFGFIVTGANPAGSSAASRASAPTASAPGSRRSTAAASAAIGQVAMNCAPALSADGSTLYVAVNTVTRRPRGRRASCLRSTARRWPPSPASR